MLNFIGTGSAFNTSLGNNGAFIKESGHLLMIDCGSSTFDRIHKSNLLEGVKKISVLITHTHPDHIGSLGDLIFFGFYGGLGTIGQPVVTIYAPSFIEIAPLLKAMGVTENTYRLVEFGAFETISVVDHPVRLDMQAIPVTHVEWLNCFGYILSYNGSTIYYSGDSNNISDDILDRLNRSEFDYFFQDTCKAEYPGNAHMPISLLDQLVERKVREKVYIMHLDDSNLVEDAKKMGFQVAKSILQ